MKHLILLVALLFSGSAYTQSDIQIVKIKHDDRSVSVYAVNNSEITYAVNVNVSLRGMKLEAPIKKSIKVTPGVDVLVAKLIPTASETHYKVNFQATAMERGKEVNMEEDVPNITIYSKNGEEKSTELRLYLKKHDIDFYEINVTYNDKSKEIYQNMLERRGIKKSDAKLPVVIIRGEVYYNIKNMKQFIKKHF